jgi:hypothetical protein
MLLRSLPRLSPPFTNVLCSHALWGVIAHPPAEDKRVGSTDKASLKLGYGALVSVLLTSAKAKADGETVGAILEEGGLSSAQVSAITDKYSVGTPRIPGYHLHPFFATIVDPLLHVTIVQVTECALAGHC